jgi:predicted nuclease of predicted toxin-antitoxin system
MSVLLDHCVPRKYQRLLRDWGYDVHLLHNHIQPDSNDSDVLHLAKTLDSVLLTVDMDFSNILTYPPDQFGGIIVLRYQAKRESENILTLRRVLQDLYRDGLRGTLVVIDINRYRLRRG